MQFAYERTNQQHSALSLLLRRKLVTSTNEMSQRIRKYFKVRFVHCANSYTALPCGYFKPPERITTVYSGPEIKPVKHAAMCNKDNVSFYSPHIDTDVQFFRL
jgi:hypothetical protein